MATPTGAVPAPPTNLPETDEQPLESPWHRACMNLLIESVEVRLAGRKDFYTGGNMFIYFSARQVRNRDYSGPDFFFVQGPEIDHDRDRLYWAVWDENGRYPDVIIELSSPTTADEDHTTRKTLYERTFQTPEYFIYDPSTQVLEGWRLAKRRYVPIEPNGRGWLWSEELGLWIGTWRGEFQGHEDLWLRFLDSDGNVVPLRGELEARRAAEERQRADAAQAELVRLRQELASRRPNGSTPPPAE
ncbi:MAG TPA: Uma2 family endonuclease [Gemmataceae bacterium]|jgi:Uma2 family endonuclease